MLGLRSRRRVVLSSALAAVLLLAFAAPAPRASVAGLDQAAEARPLVIDLTGYEDHTAVASPAELSLPEQATGIGPGSHLIIETDDGTFGCTANFVWEDGTTSYLGAAGHCFLPEDATATHGPDGGADLSGVDVFVCVANCSFGGFTGFFITGDLVKLGSVAYARQTGPENDFDSEGDVGNDFGLVAIPSTVEHLIRPDMPVFGGPTEPGDMALGDPVCHYGAGVVVGETWPTMGRAGVGVHSEPGQGWWVAEAVVTPGDSGSAIQVCDATAEGLAGRAAAGIVTHLIVGTVTSAGTTVRKAIEMATEAGLEISLVLS